MRLGTISEHSGVVKGRGCGFLDKFFLPRYPWVTGGRARLSREGEGGSKMRLLCYRIKSMSAPGLDQASRRLRSFKFCAPLLFAFGILTIAIPLPVSAREKGHVPCHEKLSAVQPGSSPDNPLDVPAFDEVFDAAVAAKSDKVGQASVPSRFECKWVRLTGFFTWVDYWHYRGRLYADPWDSFTNSKIKYWVEKFRDSSVRRAGLAQRKITIIARAYDQCAYEDRVDAEEEKRDVFKIRFGGVCHYGANNGMILTDVIVEHVHDDTPQYLEGEANRLFFNNLLRFEGAGVNEIIERTRDWAELVKRGPKIYAKETLAMHPALFKRSKSELRTMQETLSDPDGYIAHLNADERVRRLDPALAEVAVFHDRPDSKTSAMGCICLMSSCSDRWPLLSMDARNFLGDAACVSLERRDVDGKYVVDGGGWYW